MTDTYIGPYRILQKLGAGGMGQVFLCEDERLGRRVAVKQTSGDDSPEGRERLRREARAAAALNHPRLAAVYDVLETADGPHVVMEYVEGETLTSVLKRERVPIERALQIGIELAEAIAAAHAGGVIHRDLKPSNVMITVDGHVKVLDFGLARQRLPERVSRATPLTAPGAWLGTPGYTAPEQMLGSPADERTDLFGFGAVLYELFTGTRAYPADDALSLATAVTRPPVPPSHLTPGLPSPVDDIIMRLLAPQPSRRPRSADEVRTVLSAAFSSLTSASTVTQRNGRRRLRPVVLWIVAAVAIVLAGIATYMKWRAETTVTASPTRPVVLAVLPLENMTGDTGNEFLGNGFADSLITDLSTVPGLTVLSRAAVREVGTSDNPTRIARQLGATLLLGGSVQGTRDRLRVNLALTSADGTVAWSKHFDGQLASVLDLQPQLAASVSDALPLEVSGRARDRLAHSPTNNVAALAAYWRGRQLLEKPDDRASVSAAIDAFNEAVTLDANFASAYAGLADASWAHYTQTRDAIWVHRALEASDRAIALDANQPAVWVARAAAHRGTGQALEALKDTDRALQLQPAYDEALRMRGRILSDLGRADEAIQAMRQALALRPEYWGNHETLGSVLYRAGRRRDAIAEYQKALALKPDVSRVYHNLGIAYQEEKDFDRALAAYKHAVSITPSPETYSAIGTLQYAQGDYNAALASFTQAARLAPNFAVFQRNIGDAWMHLGNPAKARDAYTRAASLARTDLRVNPANPELIARLAVYLAKAGESREPHRLIEQALSLGDRSNDVHYRAAVVYALTGRRDDAIHQLDRALALGFSPSRIAAEEEFASLREDPRLQELLAAAVAGEKRRP